MKANSPSAPQSQSDLNQHLREQVGFLRSSAEAYDAGNEAEARRLATIIRLLVYDSSRSQSLLSQLGLKYILKFASLSGISPTENPIIYVGLRMQPSVKGFKYVPRLTGVKSTLSFADWWSRILFVNKPNNIRLSVMDLVLNVANKDGGAHVDPNLEASYAQFTRHNGMGWVAIKGDSPGAPEGDPALAAVRQIAQELEITLR